jgi:hypothetical protein
MLYDMDVDTWAEIGGQVLSGRAINDFINREIGP